MCAPICVAVLAAASTPAFSQHAANRGLATVIAAYEEMARRYDPLTAASEGEPRGVAPSSRCIPRKRTGATRRACRAESAARTASHAGLNSEDALNRAYLLRVIDQTSKASISISAARRSAMVTASSRSATISPTRRRSNPVKTPKPGLYAWKRCRIYRQNLTKARRGVETGVNPAAHRRRPGSGYGAAQVGTLETRWLTPLASLPSTILRRSKKRIATAPAPSSATRSCPARETVTFIEQEYLPAARPASRALGDERRSDLSLSGPRLHYGRHYAGADPRLVNQESRAFAL